MRYLAFNPVQARLAARPEHWRWSSVGAHLLGRDDDLVSVEPVLERAPRFRDLLDVTPVEQAALDGFEIKAINGRPLGDDYFLGRAEQTLGRSLRPARRGRKPKTRESVIRGIGILSP